MKMIKNRMTRNAALLCKGPTLQSVSASASSVIVANEEPDADKIARACGIIVYGNIERELGEQVLRNYVAKGGTVYQPQR